MANYANSVLATGQAAISKKNQAPEQRRKTPTVFELAVKNQEFSIPDAAELRKSPLRPVEISYFTDIAPGVGTTKAHNHTGNKGDSGKVTVTYVTHVETFSLPRKVAENSIFSYQTKFNNLYEMHWKNLRTRHDASALSFAYASRMQLSNAVMTPLLASANPGYWNEVNYALEVENADTSRFIQRVRSAMAARNYTGDLDIISDLQMAAEFEFAAAQGGGNFMNTSALFVGTNIARNNAVIDPAYTKGTVLALPAGLLAGLYWNEGLNKRGDNRDSGGPVGTFGTVADPFGSGAVADVSMYTERADTSADAYNGSTQDIVDQWELTLTVGYVLPPLSTAGDSVLMEISRTN